MSSEPAVRPQTHRKESLVPTPWIIVTLVFAIVIAVAGAWFFTMTQDISVLPSAALAALAPLYLLILYWVWRDADEQGMLAALWVVVAAFLFVIGLALYLAVRELKTAIRDR